MLCRPGGFRGGFFLASPYYARSDQFLAIIPGGKLAGGDAPLLVVEDKPGAVVFHMDGGFL